MCGEWYNNTDVCEYVFVHVKLLSVYMCTCLGNPPKYTARPNTATRGFGFFLPPPLNFTPPDTKSADGAIQKADEFSVYIPFLHQKSSVSDKICTFWGRIGGKLWCKTSI